MPDSVREATVDLACLICMELADDATTTACCGALFCRVCIERAVDADVHAACPHCREALSADKLVKCLMIDRLSAGIKRPCPQEGCDYTGTRVEVKQHEETCPKRDMEALLAEMKEELQAEKDEHKTTKCRMRSLFFAGVKDIPKRREYFKEVELPIGKFGRASRRVKGAYVELDGLVIDKNRYQCEIYEEDHDVHLWWKQTKGEPAAMMWNLKLLHPTDPSLDKPVKMNFLAATPLNGNRGYANWMTPQELDAFTKDGCIVVVTIKYFQL